MADSHGAGSGVSVGVSQIGPSRTSGAAFVTHFMPGLIIGLLVGGLAGAFLPVLLEGDGVPGAAVKGSAGASNVIPNRSREPEQLPGTVVPDGLAPDAVPGDAATPVQVPAQAPGTPPAPAEPVTTPAKPK